MWQLSMTNVDKEWTVVGHFETVTAAARRVREIEGYPVTGVFLEMYIDTEIGTDDEAFSVLHHTGKRGLYGIRRRVN